jgi:hypothetical protein
MVDETDISGAVAARVRLRSAPHSPSLACEKQRIPFRYREAITSEHILRNQRRQSYRAARPRAHQQSASGGGSAVRIEAASERAAWLSYVHRRHDLRVVENAIDPAHPGFIQVGHLGGDQPVAEAALCPPPLNHGSSSRAAAERRPGAAAHDRIRRSLRSRFRRGGRRSG